jgi:hypothetical protein
MKQVSFWHVYDFVGPSTMKQKEIDDGHTVPSLKPNKLAKRAIF